MSLLTETVTAIGHKHVSARHGSTLEVTTDDFLTPAGDCIVGIEADRAPADFDPAFASACRDADATITATLEVGEHATTLTGNGDPGLEFDSDRSLVCRTSDYVDERTVMVRADRAAVDIDRELVTSLAAGGELTVTLHVD